MSSSTSGSKAPQGPLRLLVRMACFSMLVAFSGLLVAAFGPHISSNDYLVSAARKHQRLSTLGSPKVVLVGGSNVAFGVDGELVEEALCRPAVNMGVHASLGFRFMVDEVKEELGPGDVVIVALEYTNYGRPERTNDILYLLVDQYPAALRFVPVLERPRIVLATLVMRLRTAWRIFWGNAYEPPTNPTYRADGFDERGDMVGHLLLPRPDRVQVEAVVYHDKLVAGAFHTHARDLLEHAEDAGATVLFTWPARVPVEGDRQRADTIANELREHGLPMVGEPSDYFFPDAMRYDTRYHLHGPGRRMRTLRLVKDICAARPWLCCDGSP